MHRHTPKSNIHRATVAACDPECDRDRIVDIDSGPEVLLSEVSS